MQAEKPHHKTLRQSFFTGTFLVRYLIAENMPMLQLESYEQHEHHLPQVGKFIIAQYDRDSIIVYQAFKDTIAEYAVKNQKFGGSDYDFNRMTWLKPSFLWMMHYSAWGRKENQENVLAIRVSKKGFNEILRLAVITTYYKHIYPDSEVWKAELEGSDVQLQWEPYHDLFDNKTDRKAVKIGLKGEVLRRFNEEWIMEIKNITPYIEQQEQFLSTNLTDKIELPHERAYAPDDLTILTKIDATTISL